MALQPVIKTNRDPVGVFRIRSGKSSSAKILGRMNTYLTALFGLRSKVALDTIRWALVGEIPCEADTNRVWVVCCCLLLQDVQRANFEEAKPVANSVIVATLPPPPSVAYG